MIKKKLQVLLNDLYKSDEMSEIEYFRTQINEIILPFLNGRTIKGYIKWNETVDLHIEYTRTRLWVQGVDQDVYHIMDDLIQKLFIISTD